MFDEVRLEVNVGQYLDILGAAHGPGGPDSPGGATGPVGGPGDDPAAPAAPASREGGQAASRRPPGPGGSASTRRPSTPSSGRCISAPPWPRPSDSRTWPAPCPRSGCHSARPSSCATTCSASSAILTSPANRSATTCGRASRPCWPPWPGRGATGRRGPAVRRPASVRRPCAEPRSLQLRAVIEATGARAEVEAPSTAWPPGRGWLLAALPAPSRRPVEALGRTRPHSSTGRRSLKRIPARRVRRPMPDPGEGVA